ncbi:MAG: sensor histidine kinase [Eubacteriales bacterium]|nr:sensor histidine kinase [Eubacteriales bacterium]
MLTCGLMEDPFISPKKADMIPFVYPIYHPYRQEVIGYIFTEISPLAVTVPMGRYSSENDSGLFLQIGDRLYRYEEDGNTLSLTQDAFRMRRDLSREALGTDTSVQRVLFDGKDYILISRPTGTQGWRILELLDASQLSGSVLSTFLLLTLAVLSVAALIFVLLSAFLSRTVNEPVRQLQKRMSRIAAGDFSRDPDTEWDHELGEIGRNINDLSENVLTLMNERLEDERQKRDYEYRMLQSQINPHFLYNTLNSIKWMATIQGAPGIAEMTTALSRLLKDIAKGTTNRIPLEHEVALLKDYFTIQQYRYGGSVLLRWEIDDPSLLTCRILKFTLQPIVENAIFHGIEPKGSAGTITVSIRKTAEGDVSVSVADDGIGMDPATAAALLSREDPTEKSSFFKGIGVSNVHRRLQYEFGPRYGLSVRSAPGSGTVVTVLLPFVQQ